MKSLIFLLLIISSFSASANDPVEQLRVHLEEMKANLEYVEKLDQVDYKCTDLVERVKRMTQHMEMMTDMMVRMHAGESTHEMSHEEEGGDGT